MTSTRRLATILAADVAGYSRMMGADEEGTHERLKAHLQRASRSIQARIRRNSWMPGDGGKRAMIASSSLRVLYEWQTIIAGAAAIIRGLAA